MALSIRGATRNTFGLNQPREINTAAAASRTALNTRPVRPAPTLAPAPAIAPGAASAPAQAPAPQAAAPRRRPPGIPDFKTNPLGAIGFVLSSFAAGVRGDETPLEKAQKAEIAGAGLQLKEDAAFFQTVKFGTDAVADGADREKVAAALQTRFPIYSDLAKMILALTAPGVDGENLMASLAGNPSALAYFSSLARLGLPLETIVKRMEQYTVDVFAARLKVETSAAEQAVLAPGREREAKLFAEIREAAKDTAPGSVGRVVAPILAKLRAGGTLTEGEKEVLDFAARMSPLDQLLRGAFGAAAAAADEETATATDAENTALRQARQAIDGGEDEDAVKAELRKLGFDPEKIPPEKP